MSTDPLTEQEASAQPSKLASIVAVIQSAGLLESAGFFSCYHSYGDETDPREGVVIKFAEAVPSSNHIYFLFWSDGEIILSTSPTRQSTYMLGDILTAQYQETPADMEKIIEGMVDIISKTLDLYSTSVPTIDYGPLIQIWSALHPTLVDTPVEEADLYENQRGRWPFNFFRPQRR